LRVTMRPRTSTISEEFSLQNLADYLAAAFTGSG